MKNKSLFLIILLILGCSNNYNKQLYNKKPAFYSYIIGDVHSKNALVEHYSEVSATPASCQKVITTLLAYTTLGNDYKFPTKLYITKENTDIKNIIISFSGDPSLTSKDLIKLLEPLKNSKVSGKIILDSSIFKTPPLSPNGMIEDLGTYYSQPVNSINIDENLIKLDINNSNSDNKIFIKNDLNYNAKDFVTISEAKTHLDIIWENDLIKVIGNINMNDKNSNLVISPTDIDQYILKKMNYIIKALNIEGELIIEKNEAKLPKDMLLINEHNSETLNVIIPPALKKSDNLVFDNLYLKIINNNDKIDNWNQGDIIYRNLIEKYFGINMNNSYFVDGSGLSRYNRIKPRQLFELLKKAYDMKEFVDSLPSPSEANSTLYSRDSLPTTIKAKTGYMSGIACLCGYNLTNKTPKAFVIMASSFAPPKAEIFSVIDNFINYYTK